MAGPDLAAVEHLMNEDVSFVEVRHIRHTRTKWVYDFSVPGPKNFVAEGFFIHNTTLSDSLIAGAGMISEELARKAPLHNDVLNMDIRRLTNHPATEALMPELQARL